MQEYRDQDHQGSPGNNRRAPQRYDDTQQDQELSPSFNQLGRPQPLSKEQFKNQYNQQVLAQGTQQEQPYLSGSTLGGIHSNQTNGRFPSESAGPFSTNVGQMQANVDHLSVNESTTIRNRVQNINDEIAKQRQYLPQFQGKNNHPYMPNTRNFGPDAGPHGFGTATGSTAGLSAGLLEGELQYADRNGQYPQASILRSLEKKGRGRHQTSFRSNLELLQQQQRLQLTLMEGVQARDKLKNDPGFYSQLYNQMPSSISILRTGKQGRPDVDNYNTDFTLQQYTNNLGPGMGGLRDNNSSRIGQDSAKMKDYIKQQQKAASFRKKPRRNIKGLQQQDYYDQVTNDIKALNMTQHDISPGDLSFSYADRQAYFSPEVGIPKIIHKNEKAQTPIKTGSKKIKQIHKPEFLQTQIGYHKQAFGDDILLKSSPGKQQYSSKKGSENLYKYAEAEYKSPMPSKKKSGSIIEKSKKSVPGQLESTKIIKKGANGGGKYDSAQPPKKTRKLAPQDRRQINAEPLNITSSGQALGYVNYVNGVPIDELNGSSSKNRVRTKTTTPMSQNKLPEIGRRTNKVHYLDEPESIRKSNTNITSPKIQSGTMSQSQFPQMKSQQKHSRVSQGSIERQINKENKQMKINYDSRKLSNQHINRQKKDVYVEPSSPEMRAQGIRRVQIQSPEETPQNKTKRIDGMNTDNRIRAKSTFPKRGVSGIDKQFSQSGGRIIDLQKSTRMSAKVSGVKARNAHTPQKELNRSKSQKSRQSRDKLRNSSNVNTPKPVRHVRHPPYNVIAKDNDPKYFRKYDENPSLFQLNINKDDYQHLMDDDFDTNESKIEAIYKVLKAQLREYQGQLIKIREDKKEKIQQKKASRIRANSSKKRIKNDGLTPKDLKNFAKYIKHFEFYGSQRDLKPEIKRIVQNLSCSQHKFMYCPCCKEYEEQDFDAVDNIKKFMGYCKEEQDKLRKRRRRQAAMMKGSRHERALPDDSVSEISDLGKEEILTKYLEATMTKTERGKKDRKEAQDRLYGIKKKDNKHQCSGKCAHNRPVSAQKPITIKMDIKGIDQGVSMYDESNSAHQFSLKDMSVQADSEARLDAQMQTSVIEMMSHVDQTSLQGRGICIQTSEIDRKSAKLQTFYDDGTRIEMACQTDPKICKPKTPMKKSTRMQTEKPRPALDKYKDDWVEAIVFKRAVKFEATKRDLPYEEVETDDEDEFIEHGLEDDYEPASGVNAADDKALLQLQAQTTTQIAQNTLDMDHVGERNLGGIRKSVEGSVNMFSESAISPENSYVRGYSTLGFLKNFHDKGNIKMLSESEIQYVKKLLKEKNHHLWNEPTTLNDLHRHCKYTIRKLTYQMANIDNYAIFRRLKEPTREHTLYLVYRAERLFSAKTDSEKIFKLMSQQLFDAERFEQIIDDDSIKKEDQEFIKKREICFKRIMSQINNFLESYRLFNNQFKFKGIPLREYIMTEIEKVTAVKRKMSSLKLENPELAAQEDAKKLPKVKSNVRQSQLLEDEMQNSPVPRNVPLDTDVIMGSPKAMEGGEASSKHQIAPLEVNEHNDLDMVGNDTLEVINNEADHMEGQAQQPSIEVNMNQSI